ncbi:MAG: lysophospholipid acyltransferase family protein [Flavobacteriaceae bacterium]|nr:lysophospholipid acyltransferase family protein [Flavobacteriaceae bacterium]
MAKQKTIFYDAFGHWYFIKRFLIFIFGIVSYRRYNGFNKLKISGTENLKDLPKTNVLFVSNHQTYFADVFAMYHVFCSVQNGYQNSIHNPVYLLNPVVDMYYVAAKETMNKGILTKIFAYTGAITVKRTWRSGGQNVNRTVDLNEIDNIKKALNHGWVITFPQGTTKAFAPGRRGTSQLILEEKPIVIPVVIDGFRRSFDKKGLIVKKTGIEQSMRFKKPMEFDWETENKNTIINKIMDAIEQSEKFIKVPPLTAEQQAKEDAKNKKPQTFY